MSLYTLTPDSIRQTLAAPAPSHPHPEHLYCKVCGGSYHVPLLVVMQCEYCNGTGLEPKCFKIDIERWASHHPLPGYERDSLFNIR
ncbi:MAG: hypothetical protein Q8L68_01615 [Methylococcales bacterium]|nr:hypothetical protein [Methylococcales bacterium]